MCSMRSLVSVFVILAVSTSTSGGGVCVTKIKDGQFVSEGDCENSNGRSVLMELDQKLKARESSEASKSQSVTATSTQLVNQDTTLSDPTTAPEQASITAQTNSKSSPAPIATSITGTSTITTNDPASTTSIATSMDENSLITSSAYTFPTSPATTVIQETATTPQIDPLSPSSCDETATTLERNGGVIEIYQNGTRYEVYCDMATDGGRWTVFQRRMDGSVDFYRDWEDFARGFGNKSGEFWLGLETVYQLTQDGAYELRIDLADWDGNTRYAKYGTFSISGRSDNYRLTVGQYSGTAGNSLTESNNSPFSAKDKDLDSWTASCAIDRKVAWWFAACSRSSLNGIYNDTSKNGRGVFWYNWKLTDYYSLKASEMKFRKK